MGIPYVCRVGSSGNHELSVVCNQRPPTYVGLEVGGRPLGPNLSSEVSPTYVGLEAEIQVYVPNPDARTPYIRRVGSMPQEGRRSAHDADLPYVCRVGSWVRISGEQKYSLRM